MTLVRRIIESPITRIVLFLGLYAALLACASFLVVKILPGGIATAFINRFGNAFSAAAALFCLWVLTRFVDKRPWASTGFVTRGFASETIAGYAIGMALLSAVIGVMATFGVYRFLGVNPRFMVGVPLLLYLFVAISEETLFRGYFFQTMELRWGTGIALSGTALFFGLAHLLNHVAGITFGEKLFSAVCIAFEAGVLLGAAYVATRRMWLPIGLHWAWNFFEGPFYGTHVSGEDLSGSYILSKTSGPFLLTGGAFGPEGSLICLIVCTVAGILLLRIAIKNGQWKSGSYGHAPQAERETERLIAPLPGE